VRIRRVLKFITAHPLNKAHQPKAIYRFLWWQLRSRLVNKPYVYRFTDKCSLLIKRGVTAATGNLYCGLHEFKEMGFLLHFLRENDLFIDVGAAIGSYTILASGHVGATTFSFEPTPSAFNYLLENIAANKLEAKVHARQAALGASRGNIGFRHDMDSMNHVAINGEKGITVAVDTLDNLLSTSKPVLIKIDVEGYEYEVLNGATGILQQENLKAVIIEMSHLSARYGAAKKDIHSIFESNGFRPFSYDPVTRNLTAVEPFLFRDIIYLKDVEFVKERLRTAALVQIRGSSF
jgi:FkbM family methyltransferase